MVLGALGLGALAPGCTAGLELQMAELQKQVRDLGRQTSAGQVRHEEMANRMMLLEDESARRRVSEVGGATGGTATTAGSPPRASAAAGPVKPSESVGEPLDEPVVPSDPGRQAMSVTARSTSKNDTEKRGDEDRNGALVLSAPDEPELPVVRLGPAGEDGRSRDVLGGAQTAPPRPLTAQPAAGHAIITASAPAEAALESVAMLAPKPLYAVGLGAFRKGELARSRRIFAALVQRFPEHSLADNALYWTGRALTDEKDLDGAATAYETLLSRYPTGNKVPDALLALGSVLAQKGRLADAQEKLRLLVKTFPATKAAKQAVSRLREMKP